MAEDSAAGPGGAARALSGRGRADRAAHGRAASGAGAGRATIPPSRPSPARRPIWRLTSPARAAPWPTAWRCWSGCATARTTRWRRHRRRSRRGAAELERLLAAAGRPAARPGQDPAPRRLPPGPGPGRQGRRHAWSISRARRSRPLDERRAKALPLTDLAGMLRSFDQAAWASVFRFAETEPAAFDQLLAPALVWRDLARAAFLDEYRAAIGDCPSWPGDDAADALLRILADRAHLSGTAARSGAPPGLGPCVRCAGCSTCCGRACRRDELLGHGSLIAPIPTT